MTTIPATVTVPDPTRVEGPWTVVGSGRLPENGVYTCTGPATMTVAGDRVSCVSDVAGNAVVASGAGGTATATGKNSTVMQVGTITGGLRF